jgi:2-iminobutanoate/2-iminopropanoate deaminase
MSTASRTVATDRAPAAIGPYSQAVVAGGLLFASGQIALDPARGELVAGGVEAQAEQALKNLAAVLEAGGSSLRSVLRCTVYLVSMDDFAAVNAVYARAFGATRPARATVAVAALPKGARVEIDAIAAVAGVPAVIDRVIAVVAMLISLRRLVQGVLGTRSHVSWRRVVVLVAGGCASVLGCVGLLALRSQVFEEPFFLPHWLGTTLTFFGGLLGASALLAGRAPQGLTEDAAIRSATQAAAMSIYVAAPVITLALLGITRIARATLPWTDAQGRWLRVLEGTLLIGLCFVAREPTLGGLRFLARLPGGT